MKTDMIRTMTPCRGVGSADRVLGGIVREKLGQAVPACLALTKRIHQIGLQKHLAERRLRNLPGFSGFTRNLLHVKTTGCFGAELGSKIKQIMGKNLR